MGNKICTNCKKEKNVRQFYKDISQKDNYSNLCFVCHMEKGTKICNCSLCLGKEKPVDEFGKNKFKRDGRHSKSKLKKLEKILKHNHDLYYSSIKK